MAQPQHDPLKTIDGNVQHHNSADPLSDANSKPVPAFSQESQQHQFLSRKLFQQEQTGQQQGKYVSPSDNIMSPASAKLNAFKERRFAKQAKPRTLFANTKAISSDRLDESPVSTPIDNTKQPMAFGEVKEGETKMSED